MKMRRISIIDLGTNTFHLMILELNEQKHNVLLKERRAVRLGKEGANTKIISNDAITRANNTLNEYKKISNEYSVTEFHLLGTSMLRTAINQKQVLQQIKKVTTFDIKIISGEREAFYIHKGVTNEIKMTDEPDLIMDIGGGSIEFILCNKEKIYFQKSYEIGIQRLSNLFLNSDPLQKKDIDALNQYLEEQLELLFKQINTYKPKRLIGSAGSFNSLWALYCQKENISTNTSKRIISLDLFYILYKKILQKNLSERLNIEVIPTYQAEMLNISFTIMKKIIEESKIEYLEISSYSLKEGVMQSILEQSYE